MEVTIERLSQGPDAIAHEKDGRTLFVEGGVPGDTVEVSIVKEDKRWARARIEAILEPSCDRVESRCPWADLCGGCPWAHVSRPVQLASKRANVRDALIRIGSMDPDEVDSILTDCEAPSEPWGYRNKVELGVDGTGAKVAVGMHPTRGHGLVRVDECQLLDPVAKGLVKKVEGGLSYLAHSRELGLERVGIRASSRTRSLELALWGAPGPFPRAQVSRVLAQDRKVTSLVHVLMKGEAKARRVSGVEVLAGDGHWRERVLDQDMLLSAPSFFQVNTRGAERLVELVMEGLSPTPSDDAMDLYCGAGTFTLPLAERAGWVEAVEAYGPAVRDLRRNLSGELGENVEPIGGDADREFPDLEADIIVVDPPRAGLAREVVAKLSEQPARAIAYVSCDPATLARDLALFNEHGRFRPRTITPVDLFPQTPHVEDVCLLERVG